VIGLGIMDLQFATPLFIGHGKSNGQMGSVGITHRETALHCTCAAPMYDEYMMDIVTASPSYNKQSSNDELPKCPET
jgi:hypothetical protein